MAKFQARRIVCLGGVVFEELTFPLELSVWITNECVLTRQSGIGGRGNSCIVCRTKRLASTASGSEGITSQCKPSRDITGIPRSRQTPGWIHASISKRTYSWVDCPVLILLSVWVDNLCNQSSADNEQNAAEEECEIRTVLPWKCGCRQWRGNGWGGHCSFCGHCLCNRGNRTLSQFDDGWSRV